MDLKAYEHLIRTESAARKFMLGFCWKNQQRFCPKCRQRKLYRLTDGRRRCSRCGYTFHDFSGRWINLVDLDCGQWLRLIKLFELELSSRKIAQQLSVSYKVAHRAVMILRGAIMAHAPDAQKLLSCEVGIDESYFGEIFSCQTYTIDRTVSTSLGSGGSTPDRGTTHFSYL